MTGAPTAAAAVATRATQPLLELRGLVKRFSGTLAVDGLDMEVRRGEIHALLGENGAGKSTVIKMIAGVHEPDEGEIFLGSELVHPSSQKLPAAFIHQDLALIDSLTVAENIALVTGFPRPRGVISWRMLAREAQRALAAAGSTIDPEALVSSLSIAEKSIVAIARALWVRDEVLLVLDEPTASLPEADVARLFDTLRLLRERGVAMIYVTHRLDEVFRIADRVTVLRDGRKIATTDVRATTPAELVLQIVGRPPSEVFVEPPPPSEKPVLELREFCTQDAGPISTSVAGGEIVGLVGLRGAGQDEIGRALFGDREIVSGSILVEGAEVRPGRMADAIALGVGFVSSNRAEEGMAPTLAVRENLFLNPTSRGRNVLQPMARREERRRAAELLERFDVRPRDPERLVSTLSGGNQQKVMLARWLGIGSRILVLEEPTIGVDVGAKVQIYQMLRAIAAQGAVVLLVSSDFEEVAGICNRAFVFNRGRVVAELAREDLSTAALTHLASGGASVATAAGEEAG